MMASSAETLQMQYLLLNILIMSEKIIMKRNFTWIDDGATTITSQCKLQDDSANE